MSDTLCKKCGHDLALHTFSDSKQGCDICDCKLNLRDEISSLRAALAEAREVIKPLVSSNVIHQSDIERATAFLKKYAG